LRQHVGCLLINGHLSFVKVFEDKVRQLVVVKLFGVECDGEFVDLLAEGSTLIEGFVLMTKHKYCRGYGSLKVVEQQFATRLPVQVGDILRFADDDDLPFSHHGITARMGENGCYR